ncbi:hypothetical protein GDO81_003942 [Engystomops pustulosus]|uniref:Uncharacterized protein n=1 Tax=Engystomops pustulosus TaxID=76066 RepID=A0AAV7A5B8_ENGPU|nr:hypothetical protein GDO81_003941 [Engystomops pustulosus]KAG8554958.1 hypothetical protein GDO81_003942 [Engystomops pustulosus]
MTGAAPEGCGFCIYEISHSDSCVVSCREKLYNYNVQILADRCPVKRRGVNYKSQHALVVHSNWRDKHYSALRGYIHLQVIEDLSHMQT